MKHCSKCKQQKDIDCFNKQKRNITTGLSSWCKECITEHNSSKSHAPLYFGEKFCQSCLLSKNRSLYHKDKSKIDGLENRCKECCKERSRKLGLIKKYNISDITFNALNKKQKGMCAICNAKQSSKKHIRLSVDHDHNTGEIRGLLCGSCNMGLGRFKDNVILLNKAIEYLSTGNKI